MTTLPRVKEKEREREGQGKLTDPEERFTAEIQQIQKSLRLSDLSLVNNVGSVVIFIINCNTC